MEARLILTCLIVFVAATHVEGGIHRKNLMGRYRIFGNEPLNRKSVDECENGIIIPEPEECLKGGLLVGWRFYARITGTIYLQIWRHTGDTRNYRLVSITKFVITRVGYQLVSVARLLVIQSTDFIGFYFPEKGIIPYDVLTCRGNQNGYVIKNPGSDVLRLEQALTFAVAPKASHPCRRYSIQVLLLPPGYISTGNPALVRTVLDSLSNAVFIPYPATPLSGGILNVWRLYARRAGIIYLQIWRPTGVRLQYELVSSTQYHVYRPGVHFVPAARPLVILPGDVIGFNFPAKSIIPFDYMKCQNGDHGMQILTPGASVVDLGRRHTFHNIPLKSRPCRKYSIQVYFILPAYARIFGHYPINRKVLDLLSNAVIIPDPFTHLTSGYLTGWRLYARRLGYIYLQIWRPTKARLQYKIVSITKYRVTRPGIQTLQVTQTLLIRPGDVIGFFYPGHSIIPFDYLSCQNDGGYFVGNPGAAILKLGKLRTFPITPRSSKPCRKYAIQALLLPTGVLTWAYGQQPVNRPVLDTWSNAVVIPDPYAPLSPGILDTWTFYARRTGVIYLQIWRPTATRLRYKLVSVTEYRVRVPGLQQIRATHRLILLKGDVIGFYYPGKSIIPYDVIKCQNSGGYYVRNPGYISMRRGATRSFPASSHICRNYAIQVTVVFTGTPDISVEVKEKDYGYVAINRPHIDTWHNAVFIPDPSLKLPQGTLKNLRFYARRPGWIDLQIWRPTEDTRNYRLVYVTKYHVTKPGVQMVKPDSSFQSKPGDVIGFRFPGVSVIPYDYHKCKIGGYYVHKPPTSSMVIGARRTFPISPIALKPCRKYSLQITLLVPVKPGAIIVKSGTTVIGNKPIDRPQIDSWKNSVFIPEPRTLLPAGTLTLWRFYARRPGIINLQIWRPTGTRLQYKLVVMTRHCVTRPGVQTVKYTQTVTIIKGDVFGFYYPALSIIPYTVLRCQNNAGYYVMGPAASTMRLGAKRTFPLCKGLCRSYSIQVTIRLPGTSTTERITGPEGGPEVIPPLPTARPETPPPISLEGIPSLVGNTLTNRRNMDGWDNFVTIPDPFTHLPGGHLIFWRFYARIPGLIYLQIWRPTGTRSRYTLVNVIRYHVTKPGLQTVRDPQFFVTNPGDVFGYFYPGKGLIPFDYLKCYNHGGYFVKSPGTSTMVLGQQRTFPVHPARWRPCRRYSIQLQLLLPLPENHIRQVEGIPSEVGNGPVNRPTLDGWSNYVYIPDPSSKLPAGRLITWTFYASRPGDIYLQIWRPTGPREQYRLVSVIRYRVTRAGVQVVRDPFFFVTKPGDVVGFYLPGISIIPFTYDTCHSKHGGYFVKSPGIFTMILGGKRTFPVAPLAQRPCRRYSYQVKLLVPRPTTPVDPRVLVGAPLVVGNAPIYRPVLDVWRNTLVVPDPFTHLQGGRIITWTFYARRLGVIYFQVWRPTGTRLHYGLVYVFRYHVIRTGVQNVQDRKFFVTKPGDVYAFYFPGHSIIPFHFIKGYHHGGYFVQNPGASIIKVGTKRTFCISPTKWRPWRRYSLRVVLLLPVTEPLNIRGVPTHFGSEPINRKTLDIWTDSVFIPDPHTPLSAGHLTRWTLYARRAGLIYLQIWRPTGTSRQFRLVFIMKYHVTKPGVHIVTDTKLSVIKDGDVIGFFYPGNSIIPFDYSECPNNGGLYLKNPGVSTMILGAKRTFPASPVSLRPCRKYSIQVTLILSESHVQEIEEEYVEEQTHVETEQETGVETGIEEHVVEGGSQDNGGGGWLGDGGDGGHGK